MEKIKYIICLALVLWAEITQSNCEGVTVPVDPSGYTTARTPSNNYETVSSPKLPSQSTCGHTNVTTRDDQVVGKHAAKLGAWPWMTSLGYREHYMLLNYVVWLCGGTLISERYVITAASCTMDLGTKKLAVARLGDLNLDPNVTDGAYPVDIEIELIIRHEQYNLRNNKINDIALVKLKDNAALNQYVQPICLPILSHLRSKLWVNTSRALVAAGWGLPGNLSNVLIQVHVPLVKDSLCKRAYYRMSSIMHESVICAGYLDYTPDACKGNTGNPLMWQSEEQYYLVGINTYGFPCGSAGYPVVYTRVSQFVDWIATNMNNS